MPSKALTFQNNNVSTGSIVESEYDVFEVVSVMLVVFISGILKVILSSTRIS